MNCKQGDLAIVVKSWAGNEGKVVRCLRLSDCTRRVLPDLSVVDEAIWEVDQELTDCFGKKDALVADSQLRPIRDNDGEDEMVTIAGKPQGIPAKEPSHG